MSEDPRTRGAATDDAAADLALLRARVVGLEHRLDNARLDALAEHLDQLTRDVVNDIGVLKANVAALRSEASELADRVRRIDTHLNARPFVSDQSAITVADGLGRETMGFTRDAAPAGERRYTEFEELFRGTREQIQSRQHLYVDLMRGRGPVVDLGCGRGEFLELLTKADVQARGVDLDAGMVARAREHGVEAEVGDLFEQLAAQPNNSLGGVFSAQVIEHLAPDDMWRMLVECHRVLREDGLTIIETVNVHAVRAYRFFWLDTSHTVPVFPETLLTMAAAAGFTAAVVVFPPWGMEVEPELAESLAWAGDFAVVAAHDAQVLRDAGLLSQT
jgi:SAM-dependent methyltransferase